MANINFLSGIEGVKNITGSIGIPETIFNKPQNTPQIAPERIEFKKLLDMAIQTINNTQVNADNAIKKFAAGENIELHDVMIAMQKAQLTLNLALQIKNKITEAYQEIMRMQI